MTKKELAKLVNEKLDIMYLDAKCGLDYNSIFELIVAVSLSAQTTDKRVNQVTSVLFKEYNLPDDLPIVSTGGSMGGLSALVYMAYAKRTPVACVANCPVCDLPYHYTERPDLPRTLYSAFYNYDCSLQDALKSASPLDLVDKMPVNSRYYVFHCEEDNAVNKQKHSDRFVEKMKEAHSIDYYAVPNRGHCDLTDEMGSLYNEIIVNSIINR